MNSPSFILCAIALILSIGALFWSKVPWQLVTILLAIAIMITRRSLIIVAALCLAILSSCGTNNPAISPAQQQAITATASALAAAAVQGAATYYGGPAAGALASAALSALAQNAQAYVGAPLPQSVVARAPGVAGVSTAVAPFISSTRSISQQDADKLWSAAIIARSQQLYRAK